MLGALEGHKRMSDTLELEKQTIVRSHMGTRNRLLVLLEDKPSLLTSEPPLLPPPTLNEHQTYTVSTQIHSQCTLVPQGRRTDPSPNWFGVHAQ